MSIRTRFNPLGTIGRKSLLPAGYIELEYLESTGTQYIDTGIVPDNLTGLWELSSKRVVGEDYVSSGTRRNNMRFYGYCSSRSPEVSYGRGSYVHTGYNISLWDDYVDYKHNYRNSRTITANGHVLASNITEISGITCNIVMFGYSYNTTTNVTKCRSRIKYLKLTQGQKLVRNFIPALDPTGRPCMFDTVTQQPFYNKGTGEFIYKPKNIDYITDGLILYFDAKLEAPGTKDYLLNLASGTKCQFNNHSKGVISGPAHLLVENGCITNPEDSLAAYNIHPLQPIDGVSAYGLDYSADIVAHSRITNGSLSGVFFDDTLFDSSNFYVGGGWQLIQADGVMKIRVNATTANISDLSILNVPSDADIGFHVELGKIFINGVDSGTPVRNGAAQSASFAFRTNAQLYSYRLYNRKLTVEEQMHNYAIDKKRFGVA